MALNEKQEKLNFNAACFSTNSKDFNVILIMRQYFMSTECLDIVYNKNNKVEFTHKLLCENGGKKECKNSYIEINPLGNQKIIDKYDSYIIFFDLEIIESLVELSKILNYISVNGDINNKIYLISIYTNEKNIKSNLSEDYIKAEFEKYSMINYDISIVNLDSSDELVKVIDSLTDDSLQDKNLMKKSQYYNSDKSKSYCMVIWFGNIYLHFKFLAKLK